MPCQWSQPLYLGNQPKTTTGSDRDVTLGIEEVQMWLLIHLLQHHVRYQWNSSLFAWLVSIFSDSTLIHKRLSRIMHTENIFRKDWSVECLDGMKEQSFFMEWSSLVIRPETLELKFFYFLVSSSFRALENLSQRFSL